MQLFDEKVKEIRGMTNGAISVFFNVVKFIIEVYGTGEELSTVFNNLYMNGNAKKFIQTYGLENFMSNPTGATPNPDLSLFDTLKINYTVEDPRERWKQNPIT